MNEKQLNIGIAGLGFMGVTHFKALQEISGARVSALYSRDSAKRAGDFRSVRGNFGGGGGMQDLTGIATYADYGDLLADKQVDAVDLCLPTAQHADAAIRALEAGKHVILEKPIALNLEQADAILAAEKRAGRLCLVAHVLRYFPEYALIRQLRDEGGLGPLCAAHFRRSIAQPDWRGADAAEDNGGPVVDLHIHDADFVRFLFGEPQSFSARGARGSTGEVAHIHTLYHYPDGPLVSAEGGWLCPPSLPFIQGYEVFFAKGMLHFDSASGRPPLLHTPAGQREPTLKGDAFRDELAAAIGFIRRGDPHSALSAASARASLDLVLREEAAAREGWSRGSAP